MERLLPRVSSDSKSVEPFSQSNQRVLKLGVHYKLSEEEIAQKPPRKQEGFMFEYLNGFQTKDMLAIMEENESSRKKKTQNTLVLENRRQRQNKTTIQRL